MIVFYWQEDMYELIQIIKQLEADKQNLIEKLEKDIKNNYHTEELIGNSYITTGSIKHPVKKYAQEILKIVKGRKEMRKIKFRRKKNR